MKFDKLLRLYLFLNFLKNSPHLFSFTRSKKQHEANNFYNEKNKFYFFFETKEKLNNFLLDCHYYF